MVEGMSGLTVKAGGSFITLNSGGVYISGPMVMINSGGSALSGAAGNVVAPIAPLAAAIAGQADPGRDPDYDAPTHLEPDEEEAEDEKKSWIEIELADEDDNPIAGERYKVTLPDGKTVATGTTDSNGLARVSGIDPGTCKITFPELDKDAWKKA